MRIKKVKEISLLKSKIIKVFNFSKIHFKIKEIYIVKIKGKIFSLSINILLSLFPLINDP